MKEDRCIQVDPSDPDLESNTAEVGTGMGEEDLEILNTGAAAAGTTKDQETETSSEIQIICIKCDPSSKSGSGLTTLDVKTPKGVKGAKTPKSKGAKTPKARIILEAKVMQMMYEIIEKKVLFDEAELARNKAADEKGEAAKVVCLNDYLKIHFTLKFGITGILAQQQQANFIASLKVYKQHNPRIQHFLTMCGQLNEEVYCPEVEHVYLDAVRALMRYTNYEGISERLDDGIGQVKFGKKVAAEMVLGKDAKAGAHASWKCAFLNRMLGAGAVKQFYNANVAEKLTGSGDTADFDEVMNALMNFMLEGLEKQLFRLKDEFDEEAEEVDDKGASVLKMEEFSRGLMKVMSADFSEEKAEELWAIGRARVHADAAGGEWGGRGGDVLVGSDVMCSVLLADGIVEPFAPSKVLQNAAASIIAEKRGSMLFHKSLGAMMEGLGGADKGGGGEGGGGFEGGEEEGRISPSTVLLSEELDGREEGEKASLMGKFFS
jgi:hypothetical protein